MNLVKLMLHNMKVPFSVIGVSKAWLDEQTSDLVYIAGYQFISSHQKNKIGGGTGLYLQNHFEYKLHPDCTLSDPDTLESLFVEISNPKG